MNDYSQGAFEALAWVYAISYRVKDLNSLALEVEAAMNRIRSGVALNFAEKLKLL